MSGARGGPRWQQRGDIVGKRKGELGVGDRGSGGGGEGGSRRLGVLFLAEVRRIDHIDQVDHPQIDHDLQ